MCKLQICVEYLKTVPKNRKTHYFTIKIQTYILLAMIFKKKAYSNILLIYYLGTHLNKSFGCVKV